MIAGQSSENGVFKAQRRRSNLGRALVFSALGLLLVTSSGQVEAQTICDTLSGVTIVDHDGGDVFLLENLEWTEAHCNIGRLIIGPSFTLQAAQGEPLIIEAQRVEVHGRLSVDQAGGAGGDGGGRSEGGDGGNRIGGSTGEGGDGQDAEPCAVGAGGGGGGGAGYAGTGGDGGHGADTADSTSDDNGCQGSPGGSGGSTWGNTTTPDMGVGAGGGGGAGGSNFTGGEDGQDGGGWLRLYTRDLFIASTGRISADGGNGGTGGTSPDLFHGAGGGGGASGGGLEIRTTFLELGDGARITANGGNGGNGGQGDNRDGRLFQGAGGGGGGGGRVIVQRSNGDIPAGTCEVTGGFAGAGSNTNDGPEAAGTDGDCQTEIVNGAPDADAGGPYVTSEGVEIAFDGTGSSDPNDDSLVYDWDINCDGSIEYADAGPVPLVTFPDDSGDDVFSICLTVYDGELLSIEVTTFAIVTDTPPTASITLPPGVINEMDSFVVSGAESFADGGDGSISDTIATYEWDWDFSLNFEPSGDTGPVASHQFTDSGRRFVALRVTDDDGSTALSVGSLDILNVPPTITSSCDTGPCNEAIEDQFWTYTMTATDISPEDDAALEFLVLSGPIGMTHVGGGVFEYTPSYADSVVGSFSAVLTVSDKDFGNDLESIDVSVVSSDRDDDGMPDGWETQNGLDRDDPADADGDLDSDGVSNLDEFCRGTEPDVPNLPGVPRIASPPSGFEVERPFDVTLQVFEAFTVDLGLGCDEPLPDGEQLVLTYRFAVYDEDPEENPAAEALLVIDGAVPGDESRAEVVVSSEDAEFNDNQRYYWRASARDENDVLGPPSDAAYFFVNDAQDCPTVPELLTPPDRGFVQTRQPLFVLQNSTDLDEDPILYSIVIFQDPALQQAVASSGILQEDPLGTTSWTPDIELADQSEYWWHARAIDGGGCQTSFSDPFSFVTTLENERPTAPLIVFPEDGSTVNDNQPTIVVENSFDSNRDAVSYIFEVDRSLSFDTIDYQNSGEVPEEGFVTTTWRVESTLVDNEQYYIRVQATDGELLSDYAHASFFVNHLNDIPGPPIPIAPGTGETIENTRPRLTVQNAIDADGETLLYHFQVYSNEGLTALVAERTDLAEQFEDTFWRVNRSLFAGSYWWRARALDFSGQGTWSDSVQFSINLAPDGNGNDTDTDTGDGTDNNGNGGSAADDGCGCNSVDPGQSAFGSLMLALFAAVLVRRRRR